MLGFFSMKNKYKQYTEDGYEIIYISNGFFNTLEKWLMSTARMHPNQIGNIPLMMVLRDVPAQIEFRKLEDNPPSGEEGGK